MPLSATASVRLTELTTWPRSSNGRVKSGAGHAETEWGTGRLRVQLHGDSLQIRPWGWIFLHDMRIVPRNDVAQRRRQPLQRAIGIEHLADMEGRGERSVGRACSRSSAWHPTPARPSHVWCARAPTASRRSARRSDAASGPVRSRLSPLCISTRPLKFEAHHADNVLDVIAVADAGIAHVLPVA